MKKTLFITYIIAFFSILLSCEHTVERTYILENGTHHKLDLELYNNNALIKFIELDNKGDNWEKFYSEDMATDTDPYIAFGIDSLVVKFDDLKFKSYTFLNQDSNPFYHENYVKVKEHTFKFTFTEADYENAEEIGG